MYRRIAPQFAIIGILAFLTSYAAHALDFDVYVAAARSFMDGRTDLYAADFAISADLDYHYPPAFLIMFSPFAVLPRQVALFLWSFLILTLVYWAVRDFVNVAVNAFGGTQMHLQVSLVAASVITAKYFLLGLKYGNVQLIVLALVLLSFGMLSRRKLLPAAFLMSVAIAFKIFRIVLLPYFAIRREFRFLLLTAVFLFAAFAIPSVYFGVEKNVDLHTEWFRHAFLETGFHSRGPMDMSLSGVLQRHIVYDEGLNDRGYPNVNWVNVEPRYAVMMGRILTASIYLATCLLLLGLVYRRRLITFPNIPAASAKTHLLGFGLFFSALVLVVPNMYLACYVAVFVPLVCQLLYAAKTSGYGIRSPHLLVLWTIVIVVCTVLPLVQGSANQRLFIAIGLDLLVPLSLWVATIEILLSAETNPPDLSATVVGDQQRAV